MASTSPDRWGTTLATDVVRGIPFRNFTPRPGNAAELLQEAVRWPQRVHLVQGQRRLRFGELEAAARRGAAALRGGGIGRGDRVVLCGWNSLDWVVAFWSVMAAGATAVLANPAWSATERDEIFAAIDPALVLDAQDGGLGRFAREAADASPAPPLEAVAAPDDVGVIVFTSGTSTTPRGAVLTQRALVAAQHNVLAATGKLPHTLPRDWPGDVQLQTIPLFHIGGFSQLIAALLTGSRMIFLSDRFDPGELLELVERERIARWGAIPTMLSRVLDHPDIATRDLTSMRVIGLGGAPVSDGLLAHARAVFPNLTAKGGGQVYGLSEAGGLVTSAAGGRGRPAGSAGRPLPLIELRIAGGRQEGEILVRSPAQLSGYWGRDDSPVDGEGWLHTGDLGRIDDDGYLFVTGREKDMIIRGGENISPAQVEAALLAHPAIREAAVVGLPHADLGESVAAVVVVEATESAAPEELAAFVRGRLPRFAVPTSWWIRGESLPTNAAGKVLKRELVGRWAGQPL
jgi:long-chain acyl-CoA synthetase